MNIFDYENLGNCFLYFEWYTDTVEDTKGVIRSRKSKRDRQHNGQKRKKDRQYNGQKRKKDRQHNGQKRKKDRQHNGQKRKKDRQHNGQKRKKDRQHNGQKRKDKRTNNNPHKTLQLKQTIEQHKPHEQLGVNSGTPEE